MIKSNKLLIYLTRYYVDLNYLSWYFLNSDNVTLLS